MTNLHIFMNQFKKIETNNYICRYELFKLLKVIMKKLLFVFLLCFGITSAGYSQAAGKGGAEKSSGSKVQPRGQMRHFDKAPRDPKMKHNGTAYNRKKKKAQKVDGDGFSNSSGKGKRRKKR